MGLLGVNPWSEPQEIVDLRGAVEAERKSAEAAAARHFNLQRRLERRQEELGIMYRVRCVRKWMILTDDRYDPESRFYTVDFYNFEDAFEWASNNRYTNHIIGIQLPQGNGFLDLAEVKWNSTEYTDF